MKIELELRVASGPQTHAELPQLPVLRGTEASLEGVSRISLVTGWIDGNVAVLTQHFNRKFQWQMGDENMLQGLSSM